MTKNQKPNIYSSRFMVGDRVRFRTSEFDTDQAYVRTVTFSNSKVRYSIFLKNSETTLHNIDSAFIHPSRRKGSIDFGQDNYS